MSYKWQFSVSQCLDKGNRKYMEDYVCNHIEKVDGRILFGIFGIFDGHGGNYASSYVNKIFVEELKRNNKFWINDDDSILTAIKEVYGRIQNLMWVEREKWPQAIRGYKSTAGTTATIAIIRNDTLYVGHVGDSGIVLATQEKCSLKSDLITKEHKPDDSDEKSRIERNGGVVKQKGGIVRIVWNKKNLPPKSDIEQVPFLAVARSLGDLWSYDVSSNSYHVSPEPDLKVIKLDPKKHRALVLASDGVWNIIDGDRCIDLLNVSYSWDKLNGRTSINPAQLIVNYSLHEWNKKKLSSDNISVVVVKLIPEGYEEEINVDEDGRIEALQSEILNENISLTHDYNQPINTLDYVDNFDEYIPGNVQTNNSSSEEKELLRLFVLSSEILSRQSAAWRDDMLYWDQLKMSLSHMGFTTLPKVVSHFDSSAASFESVLNSFAWSLTCLNCVCDSNFSLNDIARLRSQPHLTEFWTHFYHRIISPNLRVSVDQLIETSVYQMTMGRILSENEADIRKLMNERIAIGSLKKCQSYNSTRTIGDHCTVVGAPSQSPFMQLLRTSSLKLSQVTIVLPVSSSVATADSLTPLISPRDSPLGSPTNSFYQRPLMIRRYSDRTIDSRIPFVSCKRGNVVTDNELISFIGGKRRK